MEQHLLTPAEELAPNFHLKTLYLLPLLVTPKDSFELFPVCLLLCIWQHFVWRLGHCSVVSACPSPGSTKEYLTSATKLKLSRRQGAQGPREDGKLSLNRFDGAALWDTQKTLSKNQERSRKTLIFEKELLIKLRTQYLKAALSECIV